MSIFSYLKEHLSILDVVNEYTTLKKSGAHWSSCCPFHHEKTASFMVNEEKGIYYCFGCHAGGDLISFIAKIENCSPLEATQHLIQRYSVEVPSHLSSRIGQAGKSTSKYQTICEKTASWCREHAIKSRTITQYLLQRGFDEKSLEQFQVGYFPGGLPSIKEYIDYMKKESILVDDLLQAHILIPGKKVLYSPFEERIMFPIADHLGVICGFGGRVYKEGDTRPKYYNSKENEHFAKGSLLFGFHKAKKSIQQSGSAFLVEGYTDCIALAQHGFTNTVATLGTACTLNHLKTIARYANELNVMYDADSAGREAVLRLTELCWQVNLDLTVISLPKGQDPASLIAQNIDITPYIKNRREVFSFYIDTITDNFAALSLSQKMRIAQSLLVRLANIPDPLKRDLLVQQAAKTLDIPFQTLRTELQKSRSDTQKKESPKASSSACNTTVQRKAPTDEATSALENKVLCAILQDMRLFALNSEAIKHLVDYLPADISALLNKIRILGTDGQEISFIPFFDSLTEQEKQYTSQLILSRDFEKVDEKTFNSMLTQLQRNYWQKIIRALKIEISAAQNSGNEEKVQSLLNRFVELKRGISSRLPQ